MRHTLSLLVAIHVDSGHAVSTILLCLPNKNLTRITRSWRMVPLVTLVAFTLASALTHRLSILHSRDLSDGHRRYSRCN